MKIVKNERVSQDLIDGELFLFNSDTQKIVSLNKVASMIWELIDKKDEAEALSAFLDLFNFADDTEKKLAESDFKNVMARLLEAGCITQV